MSKLDILKGKISEEPKQEIDVDKFSDEDLFSEPEEMKKDDFDITEEKEEIEKAMKMSAIKEGLEHKNAELDPVEESDEETTFEESMFSVDDVSFDFDEEPTEITPEIEPEPESKLISEPKPESEVVLQPQVDIVPQHVEESKPVEKVRSNKTDLENSMFTVIENNIVKNAIKKGIADLDFSSEYFTDEDVKNLLIKLVEQIEGNITESFSSIEKNIVKNAIKKVISDLNFSSEYFSDDDVKNLLIRLVEQVDNL